MDVQQRILPADLPNMAPDILALDLEMANSFPHEPPVICMVGTEYYDVAQRQCMSTIASITAREEEEALVRWFLDHLRQFRARHGEPRLLTFSGSDNDLPWINERLERYAIAERETAEMARFGHLDLRVEFQKRTQNDRISLKKLEELFGIERNATISSKKVSYLLTDVVRGDRGRPIPEKVCQYLGEDVHNLLLIYDRWGQNSLESHYLSEYEYLNQLLSLLRLSRKLLSAKRSRLDSRDRAGLSAFADVLQAGMDRAVLDESFAGFGLPALPALRGRHQDLERLARKHRHLEEIQVLDPQRGKYRLSRQLQRPKGTLAVVRQNGRVLMIRRSDSLKRAPGFWGLPGGVLERGETPAQGAVRELEEELNLRGRAVQVLGTSPSMTKAYELFWVEVAVADPTTLSPYRNEVAEARWVSPGEVLGLDPLIPGAVEGFREFLGPDWNLMRGRRQRH